MAAVVWDQTGERLYETGVDHCVLYPFDKDKGYKPGVGWSGVTAVTETPSGADVSDLWADNIKYASLRATETFEGSIEAYMYPDEWLQCDGQAELVPGVNLGQQTRKTFGLSYRTKIGTNEDSEAGYKLHIVYGATASPSERAYSSVNDSPEAITFSWDISTTPVSVTGAKETSNIIIDSTKVDSTKLAKLEATLYGTGEENADPYLPLPDEIKTLLS